MLSIETQGNPEKPLVTVYSKAIDQIYGSLTAIPTERIKDISISQEDETIIVAEVFATDGTIKYINVYLDTEFDAQRLLSFLKGAS